jgi:transposase
LDALVSKGKANARKIVHAQILLKVDEAGPKWTDEQASEAFGVHTNTVRFIRERFVFEGLESALNRKPQIRPSRERTFDGEKEARLLAVACSQPPEGRVRWTLRLLAGRLVELQVVDRVSHETVRQALKKTS